MVKSEVGLTQVLKSSNSHGDPLWVEVQRQASSVEQKTQIKMLASNADEDIVH